MLKKYRIVAFITLILAASGAAFAQLPDPAIADSTYDSVVSILLSADGQSNAVGSGLIVRADGYIMTPYSLVRGAREIQVRLRNGETYDKATIVVADERRNIAILRINADGLRYIPNGSVEETQVGSRVFVLSNTSGQPSLKNDIVLKSVQMADDVPGAGKGYRILQFETFAGASPVGGLLLDSTGRSLGIVTTTPDVKGQNIAVPLSSVIGMIRSVPVNTTVSASLSTSASYPAPTQTPYPIPQGSVLVPQRGITPLSAKGPGSIVVKPTSVADTIRTSKTIYVSSGTVSFKPDQLINALNKRPEMAEWGLTFVNERDLADLIIELDHVLFTWKYTFKIYSERLSTVVATGDRIILDGNIGADDMAERVVEKLKLARGEDKKPNVQTTEKSKSTTEKQPEKSSTPTKS